MSRVLSSLLLKLRTSKICQKPNLLQIRCYAYYEGAKRYNPEEKINFEVSKNKEEWKFVDRLLPPKFIPDPIQKVSYPSGWKPQSQEALSGPYFVRRSPSHMQPVYLSSSHRGLKKVTTVRHIQGDIWQFAEELRSHLEGRTGQSLGLRVDELGSKVSLRGDYVYYTREFLTSKGL